MEDDAFGGVRLEQLLRPLTAASELSDHPSLSVPYKSKALTQLADEALEMVRREKEVLYKAKRLVKRLRGDSDWAPCEIFETEQDEMLLLANEGGESAVPSVTMDGDVPDIEPVAAEVEKESASEVVGKDAETMDGVEAMDMALQQAAEAQEMAAEKINGRQDQANREGEESAMPDANGAHQDPEEHANNDASDQVKPPEATPLQNPALADIRRSIERQNDPEAASEHTSNSGKETNGTNERHAMTTRARARSPVAASTSRTPSPSSSATIPTVHPWFLVPPPAFPNCDLGLPAKEAKESREKVLLYVQKQEQIVRSLESLAAGLMRADRLRHSVFRAAKAEGHVRYDKGNVVTDMSDGEDWYDVEDWGLQKSDLKVQKDGTYGLEKGKDEVEDGAEEEGRRGGRRRRVNRM